MPSPKHAKIAIGLLAALLFGVVIGWQFGITRGPVDSFASMRSTMDLASGRIVWCFGGEHDRIGWPARDGWCYSADSPRTPWARLIARMRGAVRSTGDSR